MNITKKIVAGIAIVALTTTSLFAYDLTDKEKAKGDVIAQKVLLLVSKKAEEKQAKFKEKIIVQLEGVYEKARKNEKMQALVGYVIEKVKSGDKAEITKVEIKEEKKENTKVETDIYRENELAELKKNVLSEINFGNKYLDTKIKEKLEKRATDFFVERYYHSYQTSERALISMLAYSEPKYYTEGMTMRSIPENEKIKTFLGTFGTKAEIEKSLIIRVEHCKSGGTYDFIKNKVGRDPYLLELYIICHINTPFHYQDLDSYRGREKMAILDAAYFILPSK